MRRASIGVGAAAAGPGGGRLLAVEKRPNIVFLLTDDQRWDMMGSSGHPIIHTPNMDRMAKDGVRFESAFVTTSICAASRASIFTGTFERTHGYTFGKPPVPARFTDKSYPVVLRSAGYRTGFVGKYGVKMKASGAGKATETLFDFFKPLSPGPYLKKQPDGTTRHLTDIMGDTAVDFLRGSTPGQPFCLSVSFCAPHAEDGDRDKQYHWPESVDHLYRDVTIPEPALSEAAFFASQPEFLRTSMNRIRWKWRFDTPEKYQRSVKGYYRMISGVDVVIGRIREELARLGLAGDTVLIFTGDNGYFLGERGFAGKWVPYEDSLHVPLVVCDPRARAALRGATPAQLVLNVDIAPTMLELAGVPTPRTYQGRSLVPILAGRSGEWRDDFFFEHLLDNPDIPKHEGVRTERWKYARYFEQKPVYEELYDLKTDPQETRNLAKDRRHAEVLDRLRKRCSRLRDQYAAAREDRR